MSRTISGSLTTAIGATIRRPAIKLTAEDHIIHLNNTVTTNGNVDSWSDICVTSDGNLVRVRVTWGGGGTDFIQTFQWQRITDPTNATQWQTWNNFSGGVGNMWDNGGCCISNNSGTLRAFAQRGTGGADIWNWYSFDNGLTWNGPGLIFVLPGNALIKGIGSAGHDDLFLLYDVFGGEAVGASFYNAGWSALVTSTLPLLSEGKGLTVVWDGNTSKYTLAYADPYTIYSSTYKPSTNTWTFLNTISPQDNGSIGRTSPHLSLINGVYNLTFIEEDAGIFTGTVYHYPRVRQSIDLVNWSNGFILHDMTTTFNCNFISYTPASTSRTIYVAESAQKVEYSNVYLQSDATQYVDISGAILEYHRSEHIDKPSQLTVTLDNSNNNLTQYVTSGTNYKPIGINTTLVLNEGYYTGTPPTSQDMIKVGQYHIKKIAFHRAPGESTINIVAEDLTRLFDFESRYQYSFVNTTVQTTLQDICVLSGVLNYNIASSALTQLAANLVTFVLNAGQAYRRAIIELARVGWIEFFLDQNEVLQVIQLNANDPVAWSYNPEIETLVIGSDDENANHIIISGKPPNGPFVPLGSVTNAEVFDDANMHATGLEKVHIYADPKLTTQAFCQDKATFILAQEQRDLVAHTISVPVNPSLQLLDVISITDRNAPIGTGQSVNARIWSQEVHYHAENALFEQNIHLEGV